MDVESWRRWWDYSVAYQAMIDNTDSEHAPWYRVNADDKKKARLNCISHLLSQIDYDQMEWSPPEISRRFERPENVPDKLTFKHTVPEIY